MRVVADMILTVAMIAFALGAVPEFQLRVGYIRSAADIAAVGVIGLWGGVSRFIGGGGELNHLGAGGGGFFEQPPEIDPPGRGDHIQHIAAEEQEIVGKGDKREDIVGEFAAKNTDQNDCQIEQRKDPCLHRDDKQQQEIGIGIHGGKAQEQAHVQIINIRLTVKDHGVNIHQQNTAEVEQIEFQRAPLALHGIAQRVIADQTDQHEKNITVIHGQRICKQPPYLPVEDQRPVEEQQGIQKEIAHDLTHEVYHRIADADIEHQIRDAHPPVFVAEALKIPA